MASPPDHIPVLGNFRLKIRPIGLESELNSEGLLSDDPSFLEYLCSMIVT